MVGSLRCSTRTSPGAWRTAPRMGGGSYRLSGVWSVAAEDLLGHGHRTHGFRPAGVEGEVREGLDQLLLGRAVVLRELQVVRELLGVPAGGERGDGDQAALLRRQLRPRPRLAEEHVVREVHQRGSEVAEHLLGAGGLLVVRHVAVLSVAGRMLAAAPASRTAPGAGERRA